jgi:hypothetical protein
MMADTLMFVRETLDVPVIVNGRVLLTPAVVVTVTVALPGAALPDTTNVAVICVALTTTTFETLMLGPAAMVAGADRFVPVRATLTVVPAAALAGVIETRVGPGGLIVNDAAPVVPFGVVMLMLAVPADAAADTVKVAVI